MTTLEELQFFAQNLQSTCRTHKLEFACLNAENELDDVPRLSIAPYLYLIHVADDFACGHLVPTAEERTLFLRVRTPFVASASLKFVTLRTFSLILVARRGFKITCWERDLNPAPAFDDPQQLLALATAVVSQLNNEAFAFLQPEQLAPFKIKDPQAVAWRSTFCTGAVVGTVAPASEEKPAEQPPVELYVL